MKKCILIVLSGPSGVGKGTIKEIVKERYELQESVSATTRKIREGEVHGQSYYFISDEEFDQKVKNNEFLEYFDNFGKRYGTLKEQVIKGLEKSDVLLEVDIKGALKVKEQMPNAVLVLIVPPKVSELKLRLEKRGTESKEEIEKRYNVAKRELQTYKAYDYVVENGDLDKAVTKVECIIEAERLRSANSEEFMEMILTT